MNAVIDALNFRHACKKFDPARKITDTELDMILDAAVLSPYSFGMEAWRFLVLESPDIREKLRPACWNQPQVTDSSHVIVILARPARVAPGHPYVAESFGRRGLPEDTTAAYIEKYQHHMETEVLPRMSLYAWCSKQCYIALANIMTTAAVMGIDSCPMEGFEKDRVEQILEIDTHEFEVVVLVALGYREANQPPRRRYPKEMLVKIR
jgi:nitroreductase